MLDYSYLLSIAIILLTTKVLGSLSERVNLPQVVGALLAGIIIGPAVFDIVDDTIFLDEVAQIGVIILMFMAGLDTDVEQIKKQGVSYFVIATFGVIIPLIGGTCSYLWFFHLNPGKEQNLMEAIFIGVVLTATSVSITVEALRELGQLKGRIGNAILGAAVVDDVMGIIILTIVTSFRDSHVSVATVLIKIVLYFIFMLLFAGVAIKLAKYIDAKEDKRRISIYVLALVFIVAYVSEVYVGIADITGAYLVGMIFSRFKIRDELARKVNVISYLFFSPIFFASIGLKTKFDTFTTEMLIFSLILLLVAIITKIAGAGLGALVCKYNKFEAFNIGIGMVSRGEVALIVAQKGYALGLINETMFSPIVMMVIVTTVITPIILKKSLHKPIDQHTLDDELPLEDSVGLPVSEGCVKTNSPEDFSKTNS